ncbi:MAG: deazaflavin-dependent nitroreductase [Roseiflexaceae bacterium]
MSQAINFPWWLKPANRVITALNRWGLAIGTQHILTVVGRKSGKPYSTPVSLLTVDGARYICTVGETGWVKNARVMKAGVLTRGRTTERVGLFELPIEQRSPILREFPQQVPRGTQFFERVLGITNDPEAFAAVAAQCPVFRIDPQTNDL